jgi:hypothetical protein
MRAAAKSALDVPHARGVQPQHKFEILSRHSDEILGYVLLSVRVDAAPELSIDRRNLIGADARASAECHMLLRMHHSWEAGCCLFTAGELLFFERGHRSKRFAHDSNAKSILESGPTAFVGEPTPGAATSANRTTASCK